MTADCLFDGNREDTLIGYLYDELDPASRRAFDAHLSSCRACQGEVQALRSVRRHMSVWAPPEPLLTRGTSAGATAQPPWWRQVPAWAQVAAALVFLGVSAGIANLNVHYDRTGLTIRTGWQSASPAAPLASSAAVPATPWRADLTALEDRLRTEMHSAPAAQPVRGTAADADVLRRVRALLDESERRQERELALRIGEVEAQRRADLVKIDQNLGQIQSNTGVEVMRQRQMLNYLVRVSQKP